MRNDESKMTNEQRPYLKDESVLKILDILNYALRMMQHADTPGRKYNYWKMGGFSKNPSKKEMEDFVRGIEELMICLMDGNFKLESGRLVRENYRIVPLSLLNFCKDTIEDYIGLGIFDGDPQKVCELEDTIDNVQ